MFPSLIRLAGGLSVRKIVAACMAMFVLGGCAVATMEEKPPLQPLPSTGITAPPQQLNR